MKTGIGYDAHRLVPDRPLVLGGVTVPHTTGLLGHSDADVLVHAVCDAVLGALGQGDIGKHFPDSDPAYKDVSSLKLLEEVQTLADRQGYRCGNLDAIIVAQKPKLAAYMEKMKNNIARRLNVSPGQVNIKATTTEGMGFEGREEGISAQAVVLLEKIG